jgi:hypothetical protein
VPDASGEPKDVQRLRRALEQGKVESALRQAWKVSSTAVAGGDAETLGLLVPIATEIEGLAVGRPKGDAARLRVYVARCLDDAREGVPRNPATSLLFRRLGDTRVKRCPDCAENVRSAARVCRYCGHRFEPPVSTAGS